MRGCLHGLWIRIPSISIGSGTPEGWTWSGNTEEQLQGTKDDIFAAIAANEILGNPFQLATCGWVLGPQNDRAFFDKILPLEVSVSCINRQVGMTPVEPGFADVKGRGKWAIPWMEDDPALTQPQLWAGRMRKDAVDAHKYGCNGLMGIHWRTRILGPNVSALAKAAWEQGEWANPIPTPKPEKKEGAVGGSTASFMSNPIEGTENDPVYQTVRYNVAAYRLKVPDGAYDITLHFCEPHYKERNKRVFGVDIEGENAIDDLDIFRRV